MGQWEKNDKAKSCHLEVDTKQWKISLVSTKEISSFPINMKHFFLFVDYNIIERGKKIFFSSFALRGSALWHLCHFFFLDIWHTAFNPKTQFSTPRSQRDSQWCGIWAQTALVWSLFVVPALLNHVSFPKLLPGAFAPSLPGSARSTSVPFPHMHPSVIYICCRAGSCKCLLLMFISVYWLLLSPHVILVVFYP